MREMFPPPDGPLDSSWTAPLETVAEAVRERWRYRFFDCADFMIMCRVRRRPRPDLVLYKHIYTRRYLNLDDTGAAYRFVATSGGPGLGRYLPQPDLDRALDQLRLWELPWMKPSLAGHREGVPWEERWLLQLPPYDRPAVPDPLWSFEDVEPEATPAQRHLRVVEP
jgi:hypothetical protein